MADKPNVRGIPGLLPDRRAMLEVLASEEYGYLPVTGATGFSAGKPEAVFAGKGVQRTLSVSFPTEKGLFEFPAVLLSPVSGSKHTIVNLAFRRDIPDKYLPAEELLDRGCTVATLCYSDVTTDDCDFTNGLAGMFYSHGDSGWGKIGMWAYAASRLLDCLEQLAETDTSAPAVIGHSRLGKTALWCGANDERFKFIFSNDSGCGGAAISRGKTGESVKDITGRFPYWFCRRFGSYAGKETDLPFDQHYLIAACAPRFVCVGSAELDRWADPESELLSCTCASPAYEALGERGFIGSTKLPEVGTRFFDGSIGYQLRRGTHFLSRDDWNAYIDFLELKG